MLIFKKTIDLRKHLEKQVEKNLQTGFVPTMGALHDGHISLLKRSLLENDLTVCSIFVNPTQFNDKKDFQKYPVTTENDILKLEAGGCDILFLPSVEEIYPNGADEEKEYDLGFLDQVLEGKFRPGHFKGVCKVMENLLKIVCPRNLYLGQKDYQQCMVIKRLIELLGMENHVSVSICPTLREPDGLAMSSRNMRLNKQERQDATAIYRSLVYIRENIYSKSIPDLKIEASKILVENNFRVDYIEITDAQTLIPVNNCDEERKIVALIASYMSDVRLIDNMQVN